MEYVELCGLDERIDKSVLRSFGHVYVGEWAGSRRVSRPRKRWIDTVKECLRKEVWKSGMLGEWSRIGGNARGLAQGMNP